MQAYLIFLEEKPKPLKRHRKSKGKGEGKEQKPTEGFEDIKEEYLKTVEGQTRFMFQTLHPLLRLTEETETGMITQRNVILNSNLVESIQKISNPDVSDILIVMINQKNEPVFIPQTLSLDESYLLSEFLMLKTEGMQAYY